MTTIAADHSMLVTDSSASDQDQVWEVKKAERIHGGIYATAGLASDGEAFYAWIRRKKRGKRPALDDSFAALALTGSGLFFFDNGLMPMRLENPHAIGSGGKAARAAMMAGADIIKAVEIVCKIDAGSSLPVQVYRLEESSDENNN